MTDKTAEEPAPFTRASKSKALALWGLLALQSFCALFFLADALADLFGWGTLPRALDHDQFEFLVVLALLLSIAFTCREIYRMLGRQKRMERGLRAAAGAFHELLEEHFETWGLTPSERDVALLAIKGLSLAEIARVRQTKDGTIKAQCNAIYRKAGVTGRTQLLSLFIEELLAESLIPPRTVE